MPPTVLAYLVLVSHEPTIPLGFHDSSSQIASSLSTICNLAGPSIYIKYLVPDMGLTFLSIYDGPVYDYQAPPLVSDPLSSLIKAVVVSSPDSFQMVKREDPDFKALWLAYSQCEEEDCADQMRSKDNLHFTIITDFPSQLWPESDETRPQTPAPPPETGTGGEATEERDDDDD